MPSNGPGCQLVLVAGLMGILGNIAYAIQQTELGIHMVGPQGSREQQTGASVCKCFSGLTCMMFPVSYGQSHCKASPESVLEVGALPTNAEIGITCGPFVTICCTSRQKLNSV